jgi:hypothetical protein
MEASKMAIKKQTILTHEDFTAALEDLRLTVAEVARDTGIGRSVLSQYRNHGEGLRREQLAKLRDYLEDKGVEFAEAKEEPATTAQGAQPVAAASPIHPLTGAQLVRYMFPIDADVPTPVVANALEMIGEADARVAELLKQAAARNDGLFGDNEYTKEAKAAMQELFTLLAGNYVLVRMLRGWPAMGAAPINEKPENLRDVVMAAFKQNLADAGLIQSDAEEAPKEEAAA